MKDKLIYHLKYTFKIQVIAYLVVSFIGWDLTYPVKLLNVNNWESVDRFCLLFLYSVFHAIFWFFRITVYDSGNERKAWEVKS